MNLSSLGLPAVTAVLYRPPVKVHSEIRLGLCGRQHAGLLRGIANRLRLFGGLAAGAALFFL